MKKIEILGMGCPKCKVLYKNAEQAVAELGIEADIVKVEEMAKIQSYGVMMTPALVIDGIVKTVGKVPSPVEISKYIKGE
ncbi:MAG: hypothetical protein A2Y40_02395 [Candidatus Margulisbacteria bacterium GWF2_35_9]|nr:MAG: hypothetical protein A2Y40_02395 [Candidatus Margulisbacteria bacterium GWF2_35_9]